MTMHPDAEAIYSETWAANSPTVWSDGHVTVTLISHRMHEDPDKNALRADEIANALVVGAHLYRTGTTMFNHQAVRCYAGSALTPLAIRRG